MSIFQFKQFAIEQDRTAMKVGTDGVLLGAWASTENKPSRILDIGTGTGILALMLAQRSAAQQIVGLEIDEAAYEQAIANFKNSLWNERLSCIHADVNAFTKTDRNSYDLIVCNPPFYSENYKSANKQRDLARFQDAMPFEDLIRAAGLLLTENGTLAVIIPFKEEENFIALAKEIGLFPSKNTRVKGNPTSEVKRSLLAFKRNEATHFTTEELVIEAARHVYTQEYIELTKAFYLKM